jgi:hypothetical protein
VPRTPTSTRVDVATFIAGLIWDEPDVLVSARVGHVEARIGIMTLFGDEPRSLDTVEHDLRLEAVAYLVQKGESSCQI